MHKEGALFPLATARHKYEIDMCTGSLPQKILLFSLPLMATGMLQLLFNAADIIVVGRYVGSHALAAVGSNGSIINLIVNLFMGISIGGSAVIAQHYGAAQYEDVSEATHTCMLVGLISGFFVMVVGVVCTPAILRLMDTPDDVLPLAILYLRIYFLGMPGSMLYNFGAAVLRGVGDTRRPLIFLFFAGIVNVGLNLLLVIQFNLSVAGVGIATVVSQYISAALVLVLVFSLFFRIIQVDGESMVPTLQNGDKLIVWGAGYEPQRGDVVIVDSYTAYGKPLVKRVIAKGGDVVNIDYQAGTVSVNGEVLQEAYIAEPTYLGYDVTFPYTVPEGTVFVMGDNRNASLDSRSSYVGCIDERDILGKVLLCFLPFSDFGVVK